MNTDLDTRPWRGDPAEIVEAFDVPSSVLRRHLDAMPEWVRDAACIGEPVDTFFPPAGASSQRAAALCGRCPVRVECLAEAMADPSLDHGWRGGLSAQARRQRRKLDALEARP